jgi:cell division protein FtsL
MKNQTRDKKRQRKKVIDKSPSLLKEMAGDILVRHWFVSLLSVVAVVSAMKLSNTSHDIRRAVAESQELRELRQQQEIEWQTLRLEMSSLTEADRISRLAKKELGMIKVSTKNEKIITL